MGKKKKKKEYRDPLEYLKGRSLHGRLSSRREHLPRHIYEDGFLVIQWTELKARYEALSQEERVNIDVQLAADLWRCNPEEIVIKYPKDARVIKDPRKEKDDE